MVLLRWLIGILLGIHYKHYALINLTEMILMLVYEIKNTFMRQ